MTILAEEKGSQRVPDRTNIDFRLSKIVNLPGRLGGINLMLDVFNIFNDNAATSLETISSNPSLYTYGQILGLVTPRMLRLGARWTF